MERKTLEHLIKWNNKKQRKPLIVYGARQVGKSYLIKDIFAERYYKNNYIYIDLKKNSVIREHILFGGPKGEAIVDANSIIDFVSLNNNVKIDKNTLLIFDEVQECLPLITALKYFKQDRPEIPIIVSGSMVRIKIKRQQMTNNQNNKESFFFPVGAADKLFVYPLTFEEFLMNYNESLYKYIFDKYNKREPLEDSYHELSMEALYKYLLIGGMPEVVNNFLSSSNLLDARYDIETIFDDYLADMELYQASRESIIRSKSIFESIYSQLEKESKNFKSSLIKPGLKNRDLKSPKEWLELANIVYESKQVKMNVSSPLKESDENNFRLYLLDNGLLSKQSNINMSTFIDKTKQNTLAGILFENYVATELTANGIDLFYWKGKTTAEFEFLVDVSNEIIPIDVKKSKGSLSSLKAYKEVNKYPLVIKISSNKYGFDKENKILTIPLYDVFLLVDDIKNNRLLEILDI